MAKIAERARRDPQYLYTVYRRKDDALIAFEESGPKAAELMGIKECTFWSYVSRIGSEPGYRCKFEIIRTLFGGDGEPYSRSTGRILYTVYRTSDDALICHEQPAQAAADAMGITVKSLQAKTCRQRQKPWRNYKYRIDKIVI